ncbi:MAG: RluA family pseudouridine synthase [Pseudomonadota bacterium]|uniref:RluA family pseudouridine synthase n=1 Tax=unclassified Phenylobacterium TaxID=2640670 RepID=UPI0009E942A9|nr:MULTISPECIES: RluA family pseudouridine synthase [unclassified Phenylobacterium]MBT9472664.1 RluA family pseudouridine synthase [Phenylobacterium sp.]
MVARIVTIPPEAAGARLDKTLAEHVEDLSRARIQALMAEGLISLNGNVLTDASAKTRAGDYQVLIPPPAPAEPQPEAIPLSILYEDADLIVIEKPPGMAVHPAPGNETGTLVNALLHHCGDSLSGIGGVARPGIVHRLDKETSGVLVAAKSDAAHQGLSKLFATHDIDRVYIALVRGAPQPPKGTIISRLGRSTHDRKKIAVLKTGGREAITHYQTERTFGPAGKPTAARISCQLETGRTHQIRVHMASKGTPCLGDPVYGSGPPAGPVREAIADAGLKRQALHAAVLGFVHPVTGQALRFESPLPADMAQLEANLSAL